MPEMLMYMLKSTTHPATDREIADAVKIAREKGGTAAEVEQMASQMLHYMGADVNQAPDRFVLHPGSRLARAVQAA